jgi:hypothetical protein
LKLLKDVPQEFLCKVFCWASEDNASVSDERLSLADLVVEISDGAIQRNACELLKAKYALNKDNFQHLVRKCWSSDKLAQLCVVCEYIEADLVGSGSFHMVMGLMFAPEDSGRAGDKVETLLEIICGLLGRDEKFVKYLDTWKPQDQQLQGLKQMLERFATSRFADVVRANQGWLSLAGGEQRQAAAAGGEDPLKRSEAVFFSLLQGFIRLCGWPKIRHMEPLRIWAKRGEGQGQQAMQHHKLRSAITTTFGTNFWAELQAR